MGEKVGWLLFNDDHEADTVDSLLVISVLDLSVLVGFETTSSDVVD